MIKIILILSVFINLVQFGYILKTEKALDNCITVLSEFIDFLGIDKATEIARKALPGFKVIKNDCDNDNES